MAYVQEVVMDALLRCLHEGKSFRDEELCDSVRRLKDQQKSTARADGELPRRDAAGFALAGGGE